MCVCNQDLGWLETPPRVERKANEEEEKERTMMMCVHAFRKSPKSASWARNWVKIECCDYANQDVGSFFSLSSRRLLFTRPRSPAHHAVGFFSRVSAHRCCCCASRVLFYRSGERERNSETPSEQSSQVRVAPFRHNKQHTIDF